MSLPGVKLTIKDRFYDLSRTNIPDGPRIAILGRRTTANGTADSSDSTAVVCQDLDIYVATDEKKVITAFGNGSDVHRGFKEALAGGAQRIYIIALPSDTAYNHTTAVITSASYTSGVLWDDAWSAVEAAQCDIVVPWGRGSGPTEWQSPATPGDDLEFAFYANNSATATNSWAYKVALAVSNIVTNSHPCFAIMGIKPYIGAAGTTGSMTPAQVSTHLGVAGLVSNSDVTMATVGMYLSVIASEMVPLGYNNTTNFGYSNSAAIYAGYVAQLDSWSAPTGKVIFNVSNIRYNPTKTQQSNLIDKGVVPVSLSFSRAPTWVDAGTFAAPTSQYTRLTTLRIVYDSVLVVRQVAQAFIGSASTTETRNALETAISRGLMGMQEAGALLASDFSVTYLPAQNKAVVDLVIRPAFELRNIDISVSIQL